MNILNTNKLNQEALHNQESTLILYMYWLDYSKGMTYKRHLKLHGLRINEELNSLFLLITC